MTTLALDSILVQQRLDAALAESQRQFVALLASVPKEMWGVLLPLAPSGMLVKEYKVECSLRVATEHSLSFSLVATPIQAGYSALYDTVTTEQASLTVEVLTVPTPVSPLSNANY